MKILFIFDRKIVPSTGGVQRVTYLLAEEFRRRGEDVSFLSVGPEELNKEADPEGYAQTHISAYSPDFTQRLKEFSDEGKYEIVIFQGADNTVKAALPYFEGAKKLLVVHNQPFPLTPFERIVKRNTPWNSLKTKGKLLKSLALVAPGAFRKVNNKKGATSYLNLAGNLERIVLLSQRYLPRILKMTPGLTREKIAAIENPNTFIVEESPVLKNKENIVLFVGRLSNPQKNVTGFIDVWEKFYRNHPDWQALVVGDGEDAVKIKQYSKRKKVKSLSFTPNTPNIMEFYRRAKILCMTSAYEGWPMVLNEAMAQGCVPVAYDTFEALHDIVKDGENGLIVPPFDQKLMVKALSRLADNPEEWKRMAVAGPESIRSFDVVTITDKWYELFETL